jgi:hypothetical protein
VPGVAELGTTSQSNGLTINGQRANQIGFYFDGVDMRTESSGVPAFSPSVEAIQEFKIQLNDFSAEYGRSPSAINLSLKSGANGFHGSVFEFLRNNKLDSRSFFSRVWIHCAATSWNGDQRAHHRNKTFFMFNYEGLRTRRANTLYQSLPLPLGGRNFAGGPQIFDPQTVDPATGATFSGNIIPKAGSD